MAQIDLEKLKKRDELFKLTKDKVYENVIILDYTATYYDIEDGEELDMMRVFKTDEFFNNLKFIYALAYVDYADVDLALPENKEIANCLFSRLNYDSDVRKIDFVHLTYYDMDGCKFHMDFRFTEEKWNFMDEQAIREEVLNILKS